MKIFLYIFVGIILTSCPSKAGLKSSNRLLDEFRVDEYRGYVVMSIKKENSRFSNIAMYSEEKKRHVLVKVPNWLCDYWSEGDTVR